MNIEHLEMTYTVYETMDGGFDVADVSGCRPLGLRSDGPWDTEEEAIAAVRRMTSAEASE